MKNKKVITSITVLFLSAIAATSGTFAWFITNREASIHYSGAKIYSTDGDLIVAYKSSLNTIDSADITHEPSVNVLSIDSNQNITDISGDGLDFYEVVWSSIDNVATIINDVNAENVGDADEYFVDFTLTISRSGGTDGFKAYLGDSTAILPVNAGKAEDVGIVKSVRMAVINYSDNSSETGTPSVIIRHGNSTDSTHQYLVKQASGTAYQSGTHNLVTDGLFKTTSFVTESTMLAAEANYPPIVDLMTATSADVTFRFYVEGTDTNAINDYISGTFKVDIDIYALYA